MRLLSDLVAPKWSSWAILMAAAVFAAGTCLPTKAVFAQEDAAAEAADEAPVAEEPAEEPAAPAIDSSIRDAQAASTPGPQVSYLAWIVDAMGWHYTIAFLAISFALVALVVMNILAARRENVVPPALVEGFEQHLNAKQYQEAYDLAKADDSFLGHILSAGLSRVSSGYSEAIEAMQEVGEEENLRMEQRLGYLALIGTISPMIGLLGTVEGMVESFMVIANTATGTPDPQELAKGISKALFTTLVGLYLAIPALMAYHIIRNRISRLVLEVGVVSEGMMRRFRKTGDKKTEG